MSQKSFDQYNQSSQKQRCSQLEFFRADDCVLLLSSEKNDRCKSQSIKILAEKSQKDSEHYVPAKLHAQISKTDPARVKLTLQNQRLECKELRQRIEEMKSSLEKCSYPVSSELNNDLVTIFAESNQEIPPFMKLFWEEQQKYLKMSPTGIWY